MSDPMSGPVPNTRDDRTGITSFLIRLAVPALVLGAGLAAWAVGAGHRSATEVGTQVLRIGAGVAISVAVVVAIVLLTRVPLREIGLTPPVSAVRAAVVGLLAWLLPAAAVFALAALLGSPLVVTVPAGGWAATVLLVAGGVLLTEAVPEELAFRAHAQAVLGERLHGRWTICAQAALFTGFAALVRGGLGPGELAMFIGMGIGLGHLRVVTGSVWTTVGFHTAFQTGAQVVLGGQGVVFSGPGWLSALALGLVPFAVAVSVIPLLSVGSTEPVGARSVPGTDASGPGRR